MQAVTEPVAHQAPSPPAAMRDVPAAAAAVPQRSRRSLLMAVLAMLGLAAFGVYLYVPSLYEVSTDDAYVDAHLVSVVPKVAAYVAALHVDDNTSFAAGTLLVELDPRDFQVVVDTADADLESARANAANVDAQVTEQHSVVCRTRRRSPATMRPWNSPGRSMAPIRFPGADRRRNDANRFSMHNPTSGRA